MRPYWTRAVVWIGGAAAALYISLALFGFAALRMSGCQGLTPLDTLWPGRWSRISVARSQYFMRQAQAAFRVGNTRQVLLALANAADLAPADYETQLHLAQVYGQLALHAFADREFVSTWVNFPKHREQTSVVWHDILLENRRFDLLGRLASVQLASASEEEKPAWLRALFVALRGSVAPDKIVRENEVFFQALPPLWRAAITAEANVRKIGNDALQQWPAIPIQPAYALLLISWGESLVDTAPTQKALDGVVRIGPAIGIFERQRLLYRLASRTGTARARLSIFDAMLRAAGQSSQRERLLAALIEFPNADCVGRLAAAVADPHRPFNRSELAGLWIAAVASGNQQVRALTEQRLRATGNVLDPNLPTKFTAASAEIWMRALPIEREVAYALALRFARK